MSRDITISSSAQLLLALFCYIPDEVRTVKRPKGFDNNSNKFKNNSPNINSAKNDIKNGVKMVIPHSRNSDRYIANLAFLYFFQSIHHSFALPLAVQRFKRIDVNTSYFCKLKKTKFQFDF